MPLNRLDKVRLDASQPTVSAWVSANAGSGKTHLLVRRLLRLLLAGVEPSKILCLTYTKAAAAEMEHRIMDTLARWAVAEDAALAQGLTEITGEAPSARQQEKARTLFAQLLDAPQGIRIDTLHAFCQTLLRRFPLEAAVPPHFSVIEEQTAREMLAEATARLYTDALRDEVSPLAEAVEYMAGRQSESTFRELIKALADERLKIIEALRAGGVEGVMRVIHEELGLSHSDNVETILAAMVGEGGAFALESVIFALQALDETAAGEAAKAISVWLNCTLRDRVAFDAYKSVYLTDRGTIRKTLAGEKKLEEGLARQWRGECARVAACHEKLCALETVSATRHALIIADHMLAHYTALKRARAMLDYHDLILHCCELLARPGISPWVMFKLDGGISHLLLDEAQDTSPEQWFIVQKLTEEFYAGAGSSEEERTVFVVGDLKQSIYSFQGADPRGFERMQAYFRKAADAALKPFKEVELPESFRSVQAVLSAVDYVFAREESALGAEGERVDAVHRITREGQAGRVEWWPLLQAQEQEQEKTTWEPLRDYAPQRHPQAELAMLMAVQIRRWLDEGEVLTARGRAMTPGDIMILMRRRGRLADLLIRELKKQGIPVAGIDRMNLTGNLAVKDLIALGAFLLNPGDDYTLAALLKSPFANLSEEQLFTLAHARGEMSLWKRLLQSADPDCRRVAEWLSALLAKADYLAPFELYSVALNHGGFARLMGRMGEEYADAVEEFLGQALLFEQSHVPSLQGFLHWLEQGETVVKRDMEQSRGQVRIMTVYGAKGLQAPVVILPDAGDKYHKSPPFLWLEMNGFRLPVWNAGEKEHCAKTAELARMYKRRESAEYHRLLYVALTRAEDRLYVLGSRGKKDMSKDSWHELVRDALAPHAQACETPAGKGLRFENVQIAAMKADKRMNHVPVLAESLPPRLLSAPVLESPLARPLAPSRIQDAPRQAASPLTAREARARGTAIHRLLQYLPDLPAQRREAAGKAWLARFMPELEGAVGDIVAQVTAVLAQPEFAPLFAPGSMAEVPVAGMAQVKGEMRVISGQIDRLAVTEDEVWIVDFKTHAAPVSAAKIPAAYAEQLAAYRALVQEVYPSKTVRCMLLFTGGPELMEVTADALRLTKAHAALTS